MSCQRHGGLPARYGLLDAVRAALGIAWALVLDNYPTLVDAGTTAFTMIDLAAAERHFGPASAPWPPDSALLASLVGRTPGRRAPASTTPQQAPASHAGMSSCSAPRGLAPR
jgi:hypothetical protein